MKKKVLTIACSTVLGLGGGMQYAYSGVNCTPGDVCEVTDGNQADITGQAHEQLYLSNGGTVTGSNVSVTQGAGPGRALMVIGSKVELIDSSLAGHSMYVYNNSELNLKNSQIELKGQGDGLEIFSSRAALEEVEISISIDRDTGLLIADGSDFNMSGGNISGSAETAIVEVYGDPLAPTPTRANFKAPATNSYTSQMLNTADDASTLIVGGNAVVSLEDYDLRAAGQRGVALAVMGEGAKVDMKSLSAFRSSFGGGGADGVALLLGGATDADVALDFTQVGAGSAIVVSGDAHGNRVGNPPIFSAAQK